MMANQQGQVGITSQATFAGFSTKERYNHPLQLQKANLKYHNQMETDRVVQKQAQGVPAWCWQTYKIKCVITAKQVFQASIQVKEII